ncbi:uncharacterized protein N7458_006243 [Penicillium daleae]|uniref:Nitronate monooxygenase domain-containing protein n=1 Tax=Penicillium daleae TaxID=63821 RepID=A0AAD6C4D5_9EURO|nr:uncharacterized protein N7458_006243 [Penicillium daleae]KAJ5449794.1 hypothetical protein N7458_006243 [Penicillium daleae]
MQHQKPERIYKTHPLANTLVLNIATSALAISIFSAGGYNTTLSTLETNLHPATNLIKDIPEPQNPARKSFAETGILLLGVGFINWDVDRGEVYKVTGVWLFVPRNMPEDLVPTPPTPNATPNPQIHPPTPKSGSKTGSITEASTALTDLTPDVLVIQGSDAGSHTQTTSASLLTLLPKLTTLLSNHKTKTKNEHERNPLTLLVAGSLTTGRTLAAALILGASGGVMGTRFLASHEAHTSSGYQVTILCASDGGVSTVRSTVYDRVWGIYGWLGRYRGRGIVNDTYLDTERGDGGGGESEVVFGGDGEGGWGWVVPGGRMTMYAGTGVELVREVKGEGGRFWRRFGRMLRVFLGGGVDVDCRLSIVDVGFDGVWRDT